MLLSPSKLLIILLALLQLVAPLMHAHASGESADNGLHIPGLEHLNVNNGSSVFLTINHPLTDECTIISVGTAIKQNKVFSDSSQVFYLPNRDFTLNTLIDRAPIIGAQYHQKNHIATAYYTLLPTRAPPSKI